MSDHEILPVTICFFYLSFFETNKWRHRFVTFKEAENATKALREMADKPLDADVKGAEVIGVIRVNASPVSNNACI